MKLLVIIALIAPTSAFDLGNAKSSLTFDVAEAKNRPVTKVINLLQDMLKQLEAEAEEDEEIYEKMACWCETNDKEKTKAIADAEAHINDLTVKIEELSAMSARLSTEIKNLEKEVADNQDALDKATALRRKELAEFNAEEKDVLASINALKAAITVLSKHHGGSLLQVQMSQASAEMFQVATMLQHEMTKHADMLQGVFTRTQKKKLAAFIQSPETYFNVDPRFVGLQDYFDAEPTFKQSYAPASGEIFGILKQMKETFETNMSASAKEELEAQKAYEALKAAKEEEIAAGQEAIDTKTQELATTDEKLAQSKQDLEDTRTTLSEDEQFLMMLKEKCQMTDQEWEERQKTRQLEMEAVSKALAFLTSDEAHDLFTKTFNPAFVEKEGTTHSKRRNDAAALLSKVAAKHHNAHLAALAVQVRLDAFTKVKKAIDDMIAALLKEKQDEIKLKDFCIESFYQNERATEKKEREKQDLIALIDDLTLQIDTLAKEIETLKMEIEELEVQLKRAGETREKENKEFQQTVADQRATQKLLAQALGVLKGFYNKGKEPLLIQTDKKGSAGPPPPPGFKKYKKNAASKGVMGMLEEIINEAKALEAEATRNEEDAQEAYEGFVKATRNEEDAQEAYE